MTKENSSAVLCMGKGTSNSQISVSALGFRSMKYYV